MAITIVEKPSSRPTSVTFSESSITIELSAWGSSDESAILTAVALSPLAPALYTLGPKTLFKTKVSAKSKDGIAWDVTVEYSKDPNYIELSIDLGTATTKKMQSLETITQYDCEFGNEVAPTFDRAINMDGQTVHGVDVESPKFDFTILKRLKMTTLSGTYLQTLYEMTPSVNHATFTITWQGQTLTFLEQELKFLGAPVRMNSNDELDITFKFSASKSITVADNITIGDSPPIEKKGWEYLWVYYEEITDNVLHTKRRVPYYVMIERVYELSDFSLLGL